MIKIKELNIISFGGIENLNLKLDSGLNVIYGSNEAGKSTVQAFIKAMLYGMGRKKKMDSFSIRERFSPWNGSQMAGSLTVDYNGKEIEISRKFGKSASGDKISVTDKISGEDIPELNVAAPGEVMLEMTAGMFEKTLWIGQGSAYMGGADEEITAKLMNLTQTHDEEISHLKALENLREKKAVLKAESKRNKPGLIDNIDLRREELLTLKRQIEEMKQKRLELEGVKDHLLYEQSENKHRLDMAEKAKIAQQNAQKIHRADKLKEYVASIAQIENSPEYIKFKDCDTSEIDEVERIYTQCEAVRSEISKYEILANSVDDDNSILSMKRQQKNIAIGSCFIMAFGVVIGFALAFIIAPMIGVIAGAGLVAIAAAIFLSAAYKTKSYDKKIEKIHNIKAEYEDNLKQLSLQLDGLNTRIDIIYEQRQVKDFGEYKSFYNKYVESKAKLEAFRSAFENLLDGEEFEKLIAEADTLGSDDVKDTDLSEYKDINCDAIRQRMFEIAKQLSDIENKLSYEYSGQISNVDIDNELAMLTEKREEAVLELKAIEAAVVGIDEAYSKLRTEFGPLINKMVNETVEFLTDRKYSDFRVSDTYRMKINCMGETKDAEYLSMGTYEQIYLALRLGISKLVFGESGIIFLDDAFSAYDDVRSKKAIELIKSFAENSQAILLSCHERDKNNAAKLGGVNVIAL